MLTSQVLYSLSHALSWTFLDSTYKQDSVIFLFLYLAYFPQHNVFQVYPCLPT
jgi:hypothetical protein